MYYISIENVKFLYSERRKNLAYLRKALEPKTREGWSFPSLAEEIGSEARHMRGAE